MFCEARFIVDVGGDQVELVLLCQQPQQDDHRPAAALPHAVINHLAGEGQHLRTQDSTESLRERKSLCLSNYPWIYGACAREV